MADSSQDATPKDVEVNTSAESDANKLKEEKNNTADELDEKEKIKKQATLLFLQGKRSVYIRDFEAAIAALSESCQLFGQIYSEHDDAMADPYFYYGKALLEVGRSESEVLGEQIQEDGNIEEDDEEEEEEEDENEENSSKEVKEENNKTNGEIKTNGTSSDEKDAPKNGGADSSTCSNDNNEARTTNSDGDNEEINDLQLSWEYLELAKLIYQRKAETCKETAIKLAETYLCLGENGLESENYSVAVEDIKQALALQKTHLQDVDRRIAETYYRLGMAYSLSQNHDEAIANFSTAIEQLNKKITSLEMRKQMGDKKTVEEEKDAFYTMEGEIQEIQAVIKDIEEKIKDMEDCKKQVKDELMKQIGGNQPGASSSNASHSATLSSSSPSSSSSTTIQATDISHLIKKKRKIDEGEETNAEKKSKTE